MSDVAGQPARASGEFAIGGDLHVRRLGYGSMQIPGPGVWGEPRDHDEVIRVLRRAIELGVTFIDTAAAYGPEVSERLIYEALHPYPEDLVIATKAGFMRPGPGRWEINGKPEFLKSQAEKSLRLLGLERIELFQLHRVDPKVPLPDQLGALLELQTEGKVGRIGRIRRLRRLREPMTGPGVAVDFDVPAGVAKRLLECLNSPRSGNAEGWLEELADLAAHVAEGPWQAGYRQTYAFTSSPER